MIESIIEWISLQPPALIYLILFVSIIVEYIFPPFPGDTILLFGGVLVNQGVLNLPLCFIVNVLGSLIGVSLLYKFGYSKGRRFFMKRQGRFFSPQKIEHVELMLKKYGTLLVLANRFLVSLRTLILIFAGIGRKPLKEVLLYSTMGVVLWIAVVMGSGMFLGASLDHLQEYFAMYSRFVYGLITFVIVGVLVYRKFFRKKITVT